jgi:YjbE family integral membrane protein
VYLSDNEEKAGWQKAACCNERRSKRTVIELLSAVAGIVLVDIALSGDNALVIGAAAAGLPRRQRWIAIFFGGAGAIVLRILFASIASFLLLLPWLQAIGGLILLIIAIRLLADRQEKQQPTTEEHMEVASQTAQRTARSFFAALLTILLADVTMSLDNVLAVGALSHGNFLALSIGILLSIAIVLVGSALVAEVMKWLPWLLDVAALVLAWTGANMMVHDLRLGDILDDHPWTAIAVPAISLSIVLLVDLLLRLHGWKLAGQPPTLGL